MDTDFRKLLADAKLPERTVAICLRADLLAEHERLERELKEFQVKGAASFESVGAGPLVEQIEALQAEMKEHSYNFRLRALPRHQFRTLLNEHQPREGNQEDAAVGVNRDTFYPLLIRACCVDPVLDEGEWAELLDEKLTDYQFQELAWAAWALNATAVNIPFSHVASLVKQATDTE